MFKRFSREVCSKNGKSRNDLLILQYFPRVLSRTWCRNNGPKCPNGKRDSREGWKRLAGRNRGFSSEGKKLIFRGGDPRLRTNPLFISPHGETHPSRVSRLVTTFPCSACPFALASLRSSLPALLFLPLAPSPPFLVSSLAYSRLPCFAIRNLLESAGKKRKKKKKREPRGTYRPPLFFSPLKRVTRRQELRVRA